MEIQSQSDSTSTQNAQELYRQCCSDEPPVHNAAFQQLGQFLLRIAYAQISDQPHLAQLAEDSSQQALFTIWKKLQAGNGPDHVEWFLTWSASIVIHKVLDELRKLTRSRSDSLEEYLTPDSELPAQYSTASTPAPEHYAQTIEDQTALIELIQQHPRLNQEAKFVLLHGYLLEQNDEELAEQLGKARSTVRGLRFRGLALLRKDEEFMQKAASLLLVEVA